MNDMITGVVLVRNEQVNIVPCLESFRPHVGEIILIDMESTDKTVELARPYVSKILWHPLVANFDPARNIAIPEARHDWLWFLDADERVLPETGRLVNEVIRQRGNEFVAITIPFKSHFCGTWMRHCGWWPGYTTARVLKRGYFRFGERLHSGVEFNGPELRLPPNPELAIDHFSYRSIEHYVEKFNRYTSTEAMNLAQQGARPDWERGIRSLVRDLWLYYERNEGFRDGYLGWILSWLAGQYRWFAEAKLADIGQLKDATASAAVPENLDRVLEVMRHELARLRLAGSGTQIGLKLRTPLFDPSGYAEDGRTLLKAVALGSRSVVASEIPWSGVKCNLPAPDVALYRALLRGVPAVPAVSITNCIPTLCMPDRDAAFNILRTVFETDRIPEFWLPHIEQFDEVWVPARHSALAFRRGGVAPERIKILPEYVDTTLFCPNGKRLELPTELKGRCVFLSVLDWQKRKGWDLLLRAYCEEFPLAARTGLLLKITKLHGYTSDQVRQQIESVLKPLGHSLESRPDIVCWDSMLDQSDMASLYRSVHAFVSASRGEGWGRPYMEAMATGLPTIGTRGSGNEDFMDDQNSFLVDTTLVRVPDDAAKEISVYDGHMWQEPHLDSLKKMMRAVYSNKAHRKAVGMRALRDMRQRFSLEAGTRCLDTMVKEVEARLGAATLPVVASDKVCVELEGEFFAGHSFANVNEQLALSWIESGELAISLKRMFHNPTHDHRITNAYRLRPYIGRSFDHPADIVIRHAFPPNWQPPEHEYGKWVHIQPWEYGYLPRDWIKPLRDNVDEIWAPSNYVKNVYGRSGIDPEKIHVIPWGVDPEVYNPEVPDLILPTSATFKFLFVGGSVLRKGIDILLRAYLEEFAGERDVCLIIKDVGTSTFYRYGNYRDEILRAIADPNSPPIVYLDKEMTDGQRASLYTACNCLVAPYRGEGFGLPVLEAMACGLAPIVPRGGATDDFVTEQDGFFVPSTLVECDHDWRLCGPATELSIDVSDLRRVIRQAFEDRNMTKAKGEAASEKVRSTFTWKKTTEMMTARIRALANGFPAPPPQPHKGNGAGPHGLPLDLSVCLVTHNDETTIANCLARVQPFVREIIVADTESSDRTVPIAREYGARVYTLPAMNSLSAIRNFTLRRATSEWILRVDPDEILDEATMEQIATMLAQHNGDVAGFSMRCLPIAGAVPELSDIRLLRNHAQIVYEGRALERVTASIRKTGGSIVATDMRIRRTSNGNGHAAHYLQFLQQDLAEQRDNPDCYYRLGTMHSVLGNSFHAECYLNEFLQRIDAHHPDYVEAASALIACYVRINDPIRAREWQTRLGQNGETKQ